MSARQPFFPTWPAPESQGTAHDQGFNSSQAASLRDTADSLHLTSPALNQSESTKTAFIVPGPFSNDGTTSISQAKTLGLGTVLKKKSALSLHQSVEKDGKAPHSDRTRALKAQHSLDYQETSRRSLGLLDPGSITRPGTTVPQSVTPQDQAAGHDIKAPIPKPAAHRFSVPLSHAAFSEGILENNAHISTIEIKHGPQRVPIEQQFGQHNIPDMDLSATMASHEITADGRLKMSAFGQTKKRNREGIEDGDRSYWAESQTKRHKSRHRDEFETRRYAKTPEFSPRPERTGSRASHAEGDLPRYFSDARGSSGLPRYGERQTVSPVNERHTAPDESSQAEQALDERRNAFEMLLGRNTNAFVQQNLEKYDALVKKWSECSEEEWIAGAEAITEKYEKVVSYVKNAMIAKINAYANIQADISRHLSDLGERDKLLDASRKKLITESGNVLG